MTWPQRVQLRDCTWSGDRGVSAPGHDATCSSEYLPLRGPLGPAGRTGRSVVAVLVLAIALIASGCGGGGGGSSAGPARPATTARLQIVSPTPNETTGTDITLKVNLIGATVVPQTTGPLKPNEGHIHVSLDGQLVSMAYGTTQDLPNLTPGPHSVQAEFVATDHAPFANRVVAAVLFNVAAPGATTVPAAGTGTPG